MNKTIALLIVTLALTASVLAQDQPKVFIQSASSGSNRNAARNQTIEMSKDFQKQCPEVKITIRQDLADYTLVLNHIEHGLFVRDNQIEVADRDGSLLTTRERGSIKNNTRFACDLILKDFAKTHSVPVTQPVDQTQTQPPVASPVDQAKQAQQYADCLKVAVDNPTIVCK
jgi:hypothetical protein